MKTATKKSVSLDAALAERLKRHARATDMAFSHIVNEALTEYARKLDEDELGAAYQRYYANSDNCNADLEMTNDFLGLAAPAWTE